MYVYDLSIPNSNGSLVITIKLQTKSRFYLAAMLLFHILQKIIETRVAYFVKTKFLTLNGTSVAHTSEVLAGTTDSRKIKL
jgi:prophage maintenance system killer protein